MSGSAYVNLIDSIFKNLYKDWFYIQKSLQKLSIILMVINRLLQSDLVKKVNGKYGIKVCTLKEAALVISLSILSWIWKLEFLLFLRLY